MMQTSTFKIVIFSVFLHLLLVTLVNCDHEGSDDPLDWLRESVPGEPGVDYPVFAEIADTSFSCADRVFGGKLLILLRFFNFRAKIEKIFSNNQKT